MQQLRSELDQAKALREEAKGPVADALDGAILALDWAIEGGSSPSERLVASYKAKKAEESAKAAKAKKVKKAKKAKPFNLFPKPAEKKIGG